MLTGNEIIKRVKEGTITITGFDESKVNPNSYNLTLNPILRVYSRSIDGNPFFAFVPDSGQKEKPLDCLKDNPTEDLLIPQTGLVLEPGILYLGSTNEATWAKDLIPCISGRSSMARLGLSVHVTAGFGDIGFKGTWTLEITVVHRLIIYPNMEICQIYFEEPVGDTDIQYHGKYQNQEGAIASRMWSELKEEIENGKRITHGYT